MKKVLLFIYIFTILTTTTFTKDINIQISEQTINSFIKATGPITTKKEVKILDQKTMIEYTTKDMVVTLKKEEIDITGKIDVNLNGSTINATLRGELEPVMDDKTGQLALKLAKFDIVGLEFLKLDKVIKKDLLIPLDFTDMKPIKVKINENRYKEIYPQITNANIVIEDKNIKILGDIYFSDKRSVLKTK